MTDKRPPHEPAVCTVKPGDRRFSGTMAAHCGQWVPRYTCPDCGRQMRMPENYLGRTSLGDRKRLVCTGDKFLRPHQQSREIHHALRSRALRDNAPEHWPFGP